jgi:hypothetical protein
VGDHDGVGQQAAQLLGAAGEERLVRDVLVGDARDLGGLAGDRPLGVDEPVRRSRAGHAELPVQDQLDRRDLHDPIGLGQVVGIEPRRLGVDGDEAAVGPAHAVG